MFVVKKLLGHFLMPLPLGLALLTFGLILALRRRRGAGACAFITGWLVLVAGGNRGVSISLTSSLENTYPPVPPLSAPAEVDAPAEIDAALSAVWPAELREADFVAVLGGGHGDAAELAAGQRLSPSARARLVEGLRLALALPETWLVVSGPRDHFDAGQGETLPVSHARVLADAAVELGFPRSRIVEIDTARDTAEEITALHRLAGAERVALVTSAWHLPRAMKLAEGEGLVAFPCPADYFGGRDARPDALAWVTWDSDSLMNTTRAWREYLGQVWARLMASWRG